jgi:hypothetical protein
LNEEKSEGVLGGKIWSPNKKANSIADDFAAKPIRVTIGFALIFLSISVTTFFSISGLSKFNSYTPKDTFDFSLGTSPILYFILLIVSMAFIICGVCLIKGKNGKINIYGPFSFLVLVTVLPLSLPTFIPLMTSTSAANAWVEEKYNLTSLDDQFIYSFTKSPVFMLDSDQNVIKATFKADGSTITLVKQEKVNK